MPPRALLTGSLAVGLVNLPIRLYTATRSEGTACLLHERGGSRIQNRSYCLVCNVVVPGEELVRGFEFAKHEYVRITGRPIEVDWVYFVDGHELLAVDHPSVLGLEGLQLLGASRGYQLLRHAMAKTGRLTVAKYTMRGKQHLVLLRPVGEGFHLHTLYYADEVADFAEVERPDVRVKLGELELAVRLIEDLAQAEFRPEQYADEYRERMRAVVERKRAGGTIEAKKPQAPPPTVDLVATLKKSLEARRPLAKAGHEGTGEQKPAVERKRRLASPGDDCVLTHFVHTPIFSPVGGPTMLRKQVVSKRSSEAASFEGEISIADVATVQVTSEEANHPIDNAFDHNRGSGGSRWIADGPRGADGDPAL